MLLAGDIRKAAFPAVGVGPRSSAMLSKAIWLLSGLNMARYEWPLPLSVPAKFKDPETHAEPDTQLNR